MKEAEEPYGIVFDGKIGHLTVEITGFQVENQE
jgi:hypothetical protein